MPDIKNLKQEQDAKELYDLFSHNIKKYRIKTREILSKEYIDNLETQDDSFYELLDNLFTNENLNLKLKDIKHLLNKIEFAIKYSDIETRKNGKRILRNMMWCKSDEHKFWSASKVRVDPNDKNMVYINFRNDGNNAWIIDHIIPESQLKKFNFDKYCNKDSLTLLFNIQAESENTNNKFGNDIEIYDEKNNCTIYKMTIFIFDSRKMNVPRLIIQLEYYINKNVFKL